MAATASSTTPTDSPGPILEARVLGHARRKFFELADLEAARGARRAARSRAVISPLALEAVRRIDALFDDRARHQRPEPPTERLAVRQERSAPLVAELEAWMREQRAKLSRAQRCRQGHGLHAQALGRLHPLPRRRPHLPDQQRRRTRAARHRPGPQVVAVRRLRSRRPARGRHVQPDRHRQDERRRSAGLARRRPRPHRRPSRPADRRAAALELAPTTPDLKDAAA